MQTISVDCVMSGWTEWSSCSKTCNDQGSQMRSREITQAQMNGGLPCPTESEERNCNREHCPGRCGSEPRLLVFQTNATFFPVDCKLGEWASWSSTCSCDGRFSSRRKMVLSSEQYGGRACPDQRELRSCNPTGCNGLDAFS